MARLETERLVLRLLEPADARHLAALFDGDWEAIKQTGRMPYPAAEWAIRRWLRHHIGPGANGFLVLRKADDAVMGTAGFGGAGSRAELGYAFGRPFWGQGYATETVRALIGLAQAQAIVYLDAYSFVDNPASARVLGKAGFEDRGIIERDYPMRGGMRRVHHFQMVFEGGK